MLNLATVWIFWNETGSQTTNGFVKDWEAIQETKTLEICQLAASERTGAMVQVLKEKYGGLQIKNGTTVTQFSHLQKTVTMVISYKCWPETMDPRK